MISGCQWFAENITEIVLCFHYSNESFLNNLINYPFPHFMKIALIPFLTKEKMKYMNEIIVIIHSSSSLYYMLNLHLLTPES